MTFFLRGLVIGFSIAAPVGPIGVLCIRRTLAEGRMSGLVSGLGAATADAIYGGIAGFGLTVVSNILISQQVWLRIIGGLFLCYLGGKTFLAKPAPQVASAVGSGFMGAYASDFLPDPYKSPDDPFLCRRICRFGVGKRRWKLCLCGGSRFGCFFWVGPMVAHFKRGRRGVSKRFQPSRIAVGQQNFRRNHYGFWSVCSSECGLMGP